MTDDDDNIIHHPFNVIESEPPDDDETQHVLNYLIGLTEAQYEDKRRDYARRLKWRVDTLDKIVGDMRGLRDQQKRGLELDRMPATTAVVGRELIDELIADLKRYVTIDNEFAATVAFWTLHTYLVNQSFFSPRLAITAPQRRCGKTTLVSWLSTVVQRPLSTVNISSSVVFRVIESRQPTLLIDEADTFLGTNEPLRGVLNSGHQQNGFVIRREGKESRTFSTFCACAISLIGSLPPTLQDRSIRIRLRRRLPNEPIASLRRDQLNDELARRCARWALDNQNFCQAATPEVPAKLFNRVADNWGPLFAIADVVGGIWPDYLRDIAVHIADLDDGEDTSPDTQLLRDIHEIFAGLDWITTAKLLDGLEIREQGMSSKRLAQRLKPYGIKPRQERRGLYVQRGYFLNDFADAFSRYVPVVPDVPVTKPEVVKHPGLPELLEATGTSGTSGTPETRPKAYRRF
jgi:putative DNA primase/helicase